ncbi:hypothetical protein CBS101457_002166 [Exobasidium rhododendri]|nr:hypothetical protein CBS101457_002166 [Exobasidium rhododendri]
MADRQVSVTPSLNEDLTVAAQQKPGIPPALRRIIIRIFSKKYGLQLHSSALSFIHVTLESHGLLQVEDEWAEAIEWLAKGLVEIAGKDDQGSSIVTRAALEHVYQQLLLADSVKDDAHEHFLEGEVVDPKRYFHVVDAFQMPKTIFDQRRKVFERSTQAPHILTVPQSKPAYLLERLQLIRNVVMRNENFLPPLASNGRGDRDSYMKLTSTTNLLGRRGQRFLLFGMLCTSSDGRYALEDADGMVGLDLQDAVPGEGIFTEGSMILVEGEYTDEERIRVFALGHPPSESRDSARLMTSTVDFTGTGAVSAQEAKALRIHEQSHSSLSFVFLSELHLDNTKALLNFRAMLQGYVDANFIPYAFVLCGSFISSKKVTSTTLIQQYQNGFSALGDLLVQFPSVLKKSHFIFVPSSEDPFSTSILPRKRLPKSITESLVQRVLRGTGGNRQMVEKFQFVSNPCRLIYFGQEIVVFRDDLMQRMLRNTIRLKTEAKELDLKKYLVSTILDQAHLCPLPQSARPILWEFDHTLRLYPMPTALVLADKFQRYELTYEGCHVFNPSSFKEGNFAWTTYYPASGKAERSELPT